MLLKYLYRDVLDVSLSGYSRKKKNDCKVLRFTSERLVSFSFVYLSAVHADLALPESRAFSWGFGVYSHSNLVWSKLVGSLKKLFPTPSSDVVGLLSCHCWTL